MKKLIPLVLAASLPLSGCLSTPLDENTVAGWKAACKEADTLEQIYLEAKASGLLSASTTAKIDGALVVVEQLCAVPDQVTGATIIRIGLQTAVVVKALAEAGVFK